MDKRIPNMVPWRSGYLAGDNRGFLDRPASGDPSETYRGSNSITIGTDGTVTNREADYGLSIMYDDDGSFKNASRANTTKHWSRGWNSVNESTLYLNVESRAGEPFDAWITDIIAPIYVRVGMAFNTTSGTATLGGKHTSYPSFQVFVNDVNVYNSQQHITPAMIMGIQQNISAEIQLCDPEK